MRLAVPESRLSGFICRMLSKLNLTSCWLPPAATRGSRRARNTSRSLCPTSGTRFRRCKTTGSMRSKRAAIFRVRDRGWSRASRFWQRCSIRLSRSLQKPNLRFFGFPRSGPRGARLPFSFCPSGKSHEHPCTSEQLTIAVIYIRFLYVRGKAMIGSGIKRGTAELAVLIEQQTNGALRFTLAALYPMLYRMEQQRWIRGSWETSTNGRRRRCYRLTPAGKKKLSPLRREWAELFRALQRLTKVAHA